MPNNQAFYDAIEAIRKVDEIQRRCEKSLERCKELGVNVHKGERFLASVNHDLERTLDDLTELKASLEDSRRTCSAARGSNKFAGQIEEFRVKINEMEESYKSNEAWKEKFIARTGCKYLHEVLPELENISLVQAKLKGEIEKNNYYLQEMEDCLERMERYYAMRESQRSGHYSSRYY